MSVMARQQINILMRCDTQKIFHKYSFAATTGFNKLGNFDLFGNIFNVFNWISMINEFNPIYVI